MPKTFNDQNKSLIVPYPNIINANQKNKIQIKVLGWTITWSLTQRHLQSKQIHRLSSPPTLPWPSSAIDIKGYLHYPNWLFRTGKHLFVVNKTAYHLINAEKKGRKKIPLLDSVHRMHSILLRREVKGGGAWDRMARLWGDGQWARRSKTGDLFDQDSQNKCNQGLQPFDVIN